jgi:hypothetical protein
LRTFVIRRRPAALLRNARIRDEGTRHLVAAVRQAGARRLIAQSIAWVYAKGPSLIAKTIHWT